jgi:hypothetical protein
MTQHPTIHVLALCALAAAALGCGHSGEGPRIPARFSFHAVCASIDQDLRGSGFECLDLVGSARAGVWGPRTRPDANTIESCFGGTSAGEGLPAGMREARSAGSLSLNYSDTSRTQVTSGLSLSTLARWLPNLDVTVDAGSELTIEITFEDRQIVVLHDVDRHIGRAITQSAPESEPFQNAMRCRTQMCANDRVLAVRALVAKPRVTLRESSHRRIGTTAGWTVPAVLGFRVDSSRAENGEVSLSAEEPVVIAAQLVAASEVLGTSICQAQ